MADDVKPEGIPAEETKPWLYLATGGTGLATLAVLAGIVFVQFLQNRPENFEYLAAHFVKNVEDTLTRHHVPPDNIQKTPPETRRDESGSIGAFASVP